jgi:hypothetical protein
MSLSNGTVGKLKAKTVGFTTSRLWKPAAEEGIMFRIVAACRPMMFWG